MVNTAWPTISPSEKRSCTSGRTGLHAPMIGFSGMGPSGTEKSPGAHTSPEYGVSSVAAARRSVSVAISCVMPSSVWGSTPVSTTASASARTDAASRSTASRRICLGSGAVIR